MSISERYAKPLRKAVYGDDSYIVSSDPLAKDATHKIERLLKALNEIARQHTSAEWDEDADGEPMGDVTEGYDGIIQFAREAVK